MALRDEYGDGQHRDAATSRVTVARTNGVARPDATGDAKVTPIYEHDVDTAAEALLILLCPRPAA